MAALERLGKLVALLGSNHAGERVNAFDAIDDELARSGLGWSDLGALIAGAGQRGVVDTAALLERLVRDRLLAARAYLWTSEHAAIVRALLEDPQAIGKASNEELARAISIADDARACAGVGYRRRGG